MKGEFTTITKLGDIYETLQKEKNIAIKGVVKKNLKRRLQLEFGDELVFYQMNKKRVEFVYHKRVPNEEDERCWFFLTTEEKVMKVAEIIRKEIEKISMFTHWSPHPDEIRFENVLLPEILEIFLKSLFSKHFLISQRVELLTKSVGQDIVYNRSNGKIKTVKHVQLGVTTKRRTGSRLGHSIPYDEVNSIVGSVIWIEAVKISD